MIERARLLPSDLWLVATMALAVLGLFVALIPAETWIRVVVLAPAVLLLPGYALTAIFFAPKALPASERLVYTVSLSVAITALTGIFVQLVLGLDRVVWAVALTVVVLAIAGLALRRRNRDGTEWSAPRLSLLGNLQSIVAIAIAVAIAIWAISISSNGAREERNDAHFTQLWILPEGAETSNSPPPEKVTIGVSNLEGRAESYQLQVMRGNTLLSERTIRLEDGASWQTSLALPRISAVQPLQAMLLRDGEVYRQVFLRNAST